MTALHCLERGQFKKIRRLNSYPNPSSTSGSSAAKKRSVVKTSCGKVSRITARDIHKDAVNMHFGAGQLRLD